MLLISKINLDIFFEGAHSQTYQGDTTVLISWPKTGFNEFLIHGIYMSTPCLST